MNATEMEYKIGLVAPSRVGKTTLVSALLAEGQTMLASTTVGMRAADTTTANRIAYTEGIVRGALRRAVFEPQRVPSTTDPSYFNLRLEPRGAETPILFRVLDYPGAWLEHGGGERNQDAWAECEAFLSDCTVLIVPVDSVLLMEAGTDHSTVLPSQLAIVHIEQLVRKWAKERRYRMGEPALLVLCPVKCESYLSDNGGLIDAAAELQHRCLTEFGGVIQAIREEADHTMLRYLPIDTFGCVELASCRWVADEGALGGYKCHPRFLVRPPGTVRRKGLDDLVMLLCRQLVAAARMQSERVADHHRVVAESARAYAALREGFFRDLWLTASGQRQARRRTAAASEDMYQQSAGHAASLVEVLASVSGRPDGPRLSYIG